MMAPRHFAQRTLLDGFAEVEDLRKCCLTKELLLLYMRLRVVLETTTQQSHAIHGTTMLLAVLHFFGKASYQIVAGDVGMLQA